jgi:hypothetical protein
MAAWSKVEATHGIETKLFDDRAANAAMAASRVGS